MKNKEKNILALLFSPSSPNAPIVFLIMCIGLSYTYMLIPGILYPRFPGDAPVFWKNHLSIIGYVAPEFIFRAPIIFEIFKYTFLCASLLWISHRFLPFSALACTISFFLMTSIQMENSYYTFHVIHPVMTGMTILCGLYVWHWKALKEAFTSFGRRAQRQGVYVPAWWRMLYLAWTSITYTFSGLNKIIMSGFEWVNGFSLQLWLVDQRNDAWGSIGRFLNDSIASHHGLAYCAELTVFLVECTCLLILPFRKLRVVYGFILAGFHLVCNLSMGFHFWGAIALNSYILIWLTISNSSKLTSP